MKILKLKALVGIRIWIMSLWELNQWEQQRRKIFLMIMKNYKYKKGWLEEVKLMFRDRKPLAHQHQDKKDGKSSKMSWKASNFWENLLSRASITL